MTLQKQLNPQTPELIDKVIKEINDSIADSLPWIENRFGQAESIRKKKEGTTIPGGQIVTFPAIFSGKKDNGYLSLLPDTDNGNYSFFVIKDPERIQNFNPNQFQRFSIDYSFIVWYNITTVVDPEEHRNRELVKKTVIRALSSITKKKLETLTIDTIEKDPDRIFREYSFNEIDSQYLIHPYAGLRINGKLSFKDNCQ